jgi:hypothetical protein
MRVSKCNEHWNFYIHCELSYNGRNIEQTCIRKSRCRQGKGEKDVLKSASKRRSKALKGLHQSAVHRAREHASHASFVYARHLPQRSLRYNTNPSRLISFPLYDPWYDHQHHHKSMLTSQSSHRCASTQPYVGQDVSKRQRIMLELKLIL